MKEQAGQILHFAEENAPVRGCTISKQLYRQEGDGISVFSLAAGTNISAESYAYHKLWTVYAGKMEFFASDGEKRVLAAGESILTPLHVSVGVYAAEDTVYQEIEFRKESIMNEILQAGEVFKLADLIP